MRSQPKDYSLSYGGDPATNHPRLSGERLAEGTLVHVIDDFVHSGAALASAVATLRGVGVLVRTASSLLSSPTAAIADAISVIDIHLTVLVVTDDLFGREVANAVC